MTSNMAGNSQKFSSIEELVQQQTSKWNLTSDMKLLGLLRNTSEDFLKEAQKNLSAIEDLSFRTKSASNKVNNVITSILILTNAKFIENRVYDEDIKDIAPKIGSVKTRPEPKPEEEEQQFIQRLDRSISVAVESLSSRFQIPRTELFDGENKYNLLHRLYLSKNRFANRPLPYVIGTEDFLKDTFVGLRSEDGLDSGPIIDLQKSRPVQLQEIDNSIQDSNDNLFDGISIGVESRTDSHCQSPLEPPPPPPPEQPNQLPPPLHKPIVPPEDFTDNNSRTLDKLFFPNKNDSVSFPEVSSEEDDDIFTRPTPQTIPKVVKPSFQFQDDSEDLFEPKSAPRKSDPEPKKPEPAPRTTAKVPSPTKDPFESDDEDDDFDLFRPKTSDKSKETKKMPKFDLSSDDDEDDLFSTVLKKKPAEPPKPSEPEVAVPPRKIESGLKSNPGMLNVINQLNTVLQNKPISPSTENTPSIPNIPIESSPNVLSPTVPEEKNIPIPIDGIDTNFNSMLKHKSQLNASRQRKPPNRTSLRTSLSNQSIKDKKEVQEVPSPVQVEPPKIESKSPEPVIPIPEPEPKPIPEKPAEKSNIFDSSSDDEDIFKKPLNLSKKSVPPKPAKVSLFDDDDDEEDFFKSGLEKTPISVPVKEAEPSKKPTPVRNNRSIFDDDSDDDLFKF